MKLKNDYPIKILKSINLIQDGLYGEIYLKRDKIINCICTVYIFIYIIFLYVSAYISV